MVVKSAGSQTQINIEDLPAGVYFLNRDGIKTNIARFLKEY